MSTSPEARAAKRFEIISHLMDPGLDASLFCAKKNELAAHFGVSYRTISRWYKKYQMDGFLGLVPKATAAKNPVTALPADFPDIVQAAIALRKECPTRSVKNIIQILELEGRIAPGTVSRSTLQRHLQKQGFGMRQVLRYQKSSAAARRFQKSYRGALYQGDIKYGPYLPIGPKGKMVQTYLAAWIDDATRFVVGAKFYAHQKTDIIEDTFRMAIMRCGQPEAIYVDNGKQYRSTWLSKACAKLGIRLLHAREYHPEGKGKIERFNRSLESFLAECALQRPETLEELNSFLQIWLDEKYHKDAHAGLQGLSPAAAWQMDTRLIYYPQMDALREAFLHTEERMVDKTGCISFNGKTYEVGMKLIGRKVEVFYDATWQDEVEIHHKDFAPFKAQRLEIGENCRISKEDAAAVLTKPDTSRLLMGLKKKAELAKAVPKSYATRFGQLAKEAQGHV